MTSKLILLTSLLLAGLARGAAEDRSAPSFILTLEAGMTVDGVRARFGPPAHMTSAGSYRIYDYAEFDDGEFGWSFVFDAAAGGPVISITRRYAEPQDFSPLFPAGRTMHHESHGTMARVRKLKDGRMLIAIGSQQLVLMRAASVKQFFPWIAETK